VSKSNIENSVERAVQLGRDNQKLIELVEAHCANARVVREGWGGMVEEQTGLPIGMRSIRCDHAAAPSGFASNLAFLVEDFYRANCIGCPHREMRGIPNLATWYEEREAERARQEEIARQAAEERARSLAARQATRRQLRLTEDDVGRELLDLLDRLDGREPGEEGHQDAEERLVATVRAAPGLLSTGVVNALFAVAEIGETSALRALTLWVEPVSRLADRLLHIAVRLLADGPNPDAAEVFVQFTYRAAPQDVEQIIDSLMQLASQVIWWEPEARPAGLLAAAGVSLPVVLDAICRHLGDASSPSTVAVGGCAAEHLIRHEPGTASVLVPRLIKALASAMDVHGTHPDPDALWHAVVRGLRAALVASPEATADAIDRVGPSRPDDEREHLFSVYSRILDPRDGVEVPAEARRVALARVVSRATGDWDLDVAATAAAKVEHIAESNPVELAGSGRTLIGTLLHVLGERDDPAHRLEMLASPAQRLEEVHRRVVRGRWLRSLAIAVGRLVAADAQLFDDALALYDVQATGIARTTDVVREVRVRLLSAFPALAVSPGRAATLMPRLYSALLDTEAGMRATAIDVCRRWVTGPGYPLPELVRAFVPTLLDDEHVVVHQAMIRAIAAVPPLPRDVSRVVVSLMGWASTYATRDADVSSAAAVAAVRLARTRGSDSASSIAEHALGVAAQFQDPWETRDVLHASAPYADRHPLWAQLAVRLLATRDWLDTGEPDPTIRRRLLEMSDATLSGALGEIDRAVTAYLPDHPGMAWDWIEVLQAAGMWEDAGRVASVIAERIPGTVEYAPRRRYAGVMQAAALVETALAAGNPELARQRAIGVTGESEAPARLVRWRAARRLTVVALGDADSTHRATRLHAAATRLRAVVSHQPADRRRRTVEAYCRTLELLVDLARWDAAIQAAEESADRWRQAAMRKAELAAADVEGTALAPLVETIRTINRPRTVDDLRRSLLAIPLPVLAADDAPRAGRSRPAAARGPRPPVGVCLLEMDGTPVSHLVLLEPDHLYDLRVTIHALEWPAWAETLEVAFNAPTQALELPILTLRRPVDVAAPATPVVVSDLGRCRLAGTQSSFAKPLVCDVMAEFRGSDERQALRVAGMPRIRLRAVDPARDMPYGNLRTEGELIVFFDRLQGQGVADGEVKVFCRFFAALNAAAKQLYANRQFRGGGSMRESQFQHAFEEILRADPQLGGRVERTVHAGGVTDIVHDGIVAELKVERTTPATIAGAARYVGQPAQYSVDADARLSILCILDWTKKDAPVGKPENYWGWLVPSMHGVAHPSHPSIVGVLIINLNLPRPSGWSRRRIETSMLDAGDSPSGFADGGPVGSDPDDLGGQSGTPD
jgi:hypothetical protein